MHAHAVNMGICERLFARDVSCVVISCSTYVSCSCWCLDVFGILVVFPQGGLESLSADDLGAGVRVVDVSGSVSSAGLVQVRAGRGFGTVCGMNAGAADVLCKQLGFGFGSVSSSSCSTYGGSSLCGEASSLISVKDLSCTGHEWDITECTWAAPDASCLNHEHDAVVYCGTEETGLHDGLLRLIARDGSPSIDGGGRLEMFKAGSWAPVCNSGFAPGSVGVACKQMGFSGASSEATSSCAIDGPSACGVTPPYVSKLSCSGHEATVLECAFEEGDDVFCAPEESVMIKCSGDGDTQGRPAKVTSPERLPQLRQHRSL